MSRRLHVRPQALMLVFLLVVGPLAGCFGEGEQPVAVTGDDVLTIDGRPASEALIRAGEWHDLLLVGEGLRLSLIHI